MIKWHNDMAEGILAERELEIQAGKKQNDVKSLSFEYVQCGFLIWGIGMCLAFVAFLGEIFWYETRDKSKDERFKWGELILFDCMEENRRKRGRWGRFKDMVMRTK